MRALVTGAEGFLGANLCRELIAQGHEVIGTSLNRAKHTSLDALNVNCRIEYGDVTDPAFVDRVVNSSEADWVFHLAAVSIVRIANANPARTLQTNIMGTLNVVDACQRMHVKRVLVASSDKAYGDHNGQPYTESTSLRPTGAYEVSKTCADHIGILYNATVVRCANLYGPADLNFSRMIPNSCRRSLKGEAPIVYGDAINDKREWIYVQDAVNAYIHLAKRGEAGAYNVGSNWQMSPLGIADLIANMLFSKVPEVVNKEHAFYEIPTQVLDCEKIASTGWQPEFDIYQGLKQTVNWYQGYLK